MNKETRVKGVRISEGIAVGVSFILAPFFTPIKERSIPKDEIEDEVSRFFHAVEKSKQDLSELCNEMKEKEINEGVQILKAHLHLIDDPLMTTEIEAAIRKTRKNAEVVFRDCVSVYRSQFLQMEDPYLRSRFADVEEIGKRVLNHLAGAGGERHEGCPECAVVFAYELSAADIASLDTGRVAAVVTTVGGETTHAAIIARARGIPFISDIQDFTTLLSYPKERVIVDGNLGEVIFSPTARTFTEYCQKMTTCMPKQTSLHPQFQLCSETMDGYQLKVSANIDMVEEVEQLMLFGGTGIGLFRSEFLFLLKGEFPTEEEQFQQYFSILETLKGRSVVIRSFDFGGDKGGLPQLVSTSDQPFMGSRSIRYLLEEKVILKRQLRAILRASYYGQLSIMFPMISSVKEIRGAIALIEEAKKELKDKGVPFDNQVRVGCMIEVPSAALIADLLAKECDFLSIGTNDLIQYSLATDRRRQSVENPSPVDPSLLRMIKWIVTEANRSGIPVSVCGEMAADPRYTPLLIGLGVHELSVSCRHLTQIKQTIRRVSAVEASVLVDKALTLSSSEEIMDLLSRI